MKKIEALLKEGPPVNAVQLDDARQRFLDQATADGLIDVAWATVDTPVSQMILASTDAGLVKVALHNEPGVLEELAHGVSPRVLESPKKLDKIRRQFDEYFAGKRQVFDLPIDWRLSRGFRKVVLERLYTDIRFGEVTSYGELAQMCGAPRAARAVGTAMATNPVPIVVPCHRVLRTGGHLGGYGGGLDMKRWLLTHEGSLLT